jgi:hypothetical protein
MKKVGEGTYGKVYLFEGEGEDAKPTPMVLKLLKFNSDVKEDNEEGNEGTMPSVPSPPEVSAYQKSVSHHRRIQFQSPENISPTSSGESSVASSEDLLKSECEFIVNFLHL